MLERTLGIQMERLKPDLEPFEQREQKRLAEVARIDALPQPAARMRRLPGEFLQAHFEN